MQTHDILSNLTHLNFKTINLTFQCTYNQFKSVSTYFAVHIIWHISNLSKICWDRKLKVLLKPLKKISVLIADQIITLQKKSLTQRDVIVEVVH